VTTLLCPCGRSFEARVSHGFVQIRCRFWPLCEQVELYRRRSESGLVLTTGQDRWKTRRRDA
jgi:hypothetical protein